jgi:hypothetical protein
MHNNSFIATVVGVNSIKTNLQTYNLWMSSKLQVCKFVLIQFAIPEWQNVFHSKCQNVSFAILTFVIVEETPPIMTSYNFVAYLCAGFVLGWKSG